MFTFKCELYAMDDTFVTIVENFGTTSKFLITETSCCAISECQRVVVEKKNQTQRKDIGGRLYTIKASRATKSETERAKKPIYVRQSRWFVCASAHIRLFDPILFTQSTVRCRSLNLHEVGNCSSTFEISRLNRPPLYAVRNFTAVALQLSTTSVYTLESRSTRSRLDQPVCLIEKGMHLSS